MYVCYDIAHPAQFLLCREDRAVFKLIAAELPLASPVCVSFSYAVDGSAGGGDPVTPSVVLVCTTPLGGYHYITLLCTSTSEGGGLDAPSPLPQSPEQADLAEKLQEKYALVPSLVCARADDRTDYLPSTDAGRVGVDSRGGWRTETFVLCDKALKTLTVREVRLSICVAGAPSEEPRHVSLDIGAVRVFKVHVTTPTSFVFSLSAHRANPPCS